MEASSILDRTVRTIWLFRSEGVHPAWVDKFTLPIVGSAAFLEFSDGNLIKVSPCEVDVPSEGYPFLGLELSSCTLEALSFVAFGGHAVEAVPLEEATSIVPFTISEVEESDPLGEDAVNQYALTTSNGWRITLHHIFPPMTLGMCVEFLGGAPNKSLKADALKGAA